MSQSVGRSRSGSKIQRSTIQCARAASVKIGPNNPPYADGIGRFISHDLRNNAHSIGVIVSEMTSEISTATSS